MANPQNKFPKQLACLVLILALVFVASSWKYLALLALLSSGSGPFNDALFFRPCGNCTGDDVGISTIKLLNECGMPDRAMELVSAKAQRRIADKWDESAMDISFYLTRIDQAGTVPSRRWLELTDVYKNILDTRLNRLASAETITENERYRFSCAEKRLALNFIEGLENHNLDSLCLHYFDRILAVSQKVTSKADRTVLLKLCEFYSRHPELKEGRDRTIKLVKQAIENSEDRRECKDRLYRKKRTDGKGYFYSFMCRCEQTIQPDPHSGAVCKCVCYKEDKNSIEYCTCEHVDFVLVSDGDYL